ncbi:MAG TPA: hypothetical protein VMG10_35850 [Gemmataceae bacterium]|nr:hypothetical protein [Gemmataceae bacterium]
MIIVWQGAGILVAVIAVAALFAGDKVAEALFGPEASSAIHNLTVQWFAGTLTLALAVLLRIPRFFETESETKQEVVVRTKHTFFFIPVGVWAAIFFALGIVVYYVTPRPGPAICEVTPSAIAEMKQREHAKPGNRYVRIKAYWPKGARSPQYSIRPVPSVNPKTDYEFNTSEVKIVVLKRQVEMLQGAEIDFVEGKFRVNNPNLEGEQLNKWKRSLELEGPID